MARNTSAVLVLVLSPYSKQFAGFPEATNIQLRGVEEVPLFPQKLFCLTAPDVGRLLLKFPGFRHFLADPFRKHCLCCDLHGSLRWSVRYRRLCRLRASSG